MKMPVLVPLALDTLFFGGVTPADPAPAAPAGTAFSDVLSQAVEPEPSDTAGDEPASRTEAEEEDQRAPSGFAIPVFPTPLWIEAPIAWESAMAVVEPGPAEVQAVSLPPREIAPMEVAPQTAAVTGLPERMEMPLMRGLLVKEDPAPLNKEASPTESLAETSNAAPDREAAQADVRIVSTAKTDAEIAPPKLDSARPETGTQPPEAETVAPERGIVPPRAETPPPKLGAAAATGSAALPVADGALPEDETAPPVTTAPGFVPQEAAQEPPRPAEPERDQTFAQGERAEPRRREAAGVFPSEPAPVQREAVRAERIPRPAEPATPAVKTTPAGNSEMPVRNAPVREAFQLRAVVEKQGEGKPQTPAPTWRTEESSEAPAGDTNAPFERAQQSGAPRVQVQEDAARNREFERSQPERERRMPTAETRSPERGLTPPLATQDIAAPARRTETRLESAPIRPVAWIEPDAPLETPPQPAQEWNLRIPTGEPDQTVAVRIRQTPQGIDIGVRASQPELVARLRSDLPELIDGLRREGFRAEAASSVASRADTAEPVTPREEAAWAGDPRHPRRESQDWPEQRHRRPRPAFERDHDDQ